MSLLKEQLADVLKTLTQGKKEFLLDSDLKTEILKTLEEVGKVFNVTRERIRQIEAKALRKLRHPSRSKKIKGLFRLMVTQEQINRINELARKSKAEGLNEAEKKSRRSFAVSILTASRKALWVSLKTHILLMKRAIKRRLREKANEKN